MANSKGRKKVFLLSALKIPYILLYRYSPADRLKFSKDYPYLARVYSYLLKLIGKRLKLPVKRCECCGISFLPDYRAKNQQKYCPYGCVELNRKRNRKKAKERYRKKSRAKRLASRYNQSYRDRKREGCVFEMPEISGRGKEEIERKLRAQIKFLYKGLNPGVSSKKLKQLDRILNKLSHRMNA